MKKVLFILALVAVVAVVGYGFSHTLAAKTGPAVGNVAPEFTLPDLNGKNVSLQKVIAANKVTLVNFWATWCPPCRAEIPELETFYQAYAKQQVALLGVNLQQQPAEVRNFVSRNKMSFPVLTDTSGAVGNTYQIYAIPTTFIIDQAGKIRAKIEGSTDLNTLKNKVLPLLKE